MWRSCERCGATVANKADRCYRCEPKRPPGEMRSCATCGKEFFVPRWKALDVKRHQGKYCSMPCKRSGQGLHLRKPPEERRPWVNNQGYRVVPVAYEHPFASKGRLLEHRLVMEQSIGRPLETHESVHHINGNRLDNRLENLRLISARAHPLLHPQTSTLVTLECNVCGKEFLAKPSKVLEGRKYCSRECYYKARWG